MNNYTKEDIKIMDSADLARISDGTRIEEIRKFAKISNVSKIGIAYCVMFAKEAEILKNILKDEFQVYEIGCKTGNIPSYEMLGREAKGISCNPAGQAEYLAENNTELNISMGLCIGHDIVFNSKSKTMTTTLVIKDRKHKHNVMKNFCEEI